MSKRTAQYGFPSSPEELVRDFDAAGRLKDIRDADALRESLAPRWWEAIFWVLQFVAALGLLGAAMLFTEVNNTDPGRVMVFFLALCVLSIVLTSEFILFKLHHLRRANAISVRMIQDLRRRIEQLEAATPQPAAQPAPQPAPAVSQSGAGQA